jgi:hypothetical protein
LWPRRRAPAAPRRTQRALARCRGRRSPRHGTAGRCQCRWTWADHTNPRWPCTLESRPGWTHTYLVVGRFSITTSKRSDRKCSTRLIRLIPTRLASAFSVSGPEVSQQLSIHISSHLLHLCPGTISFQQLHIYSSGNNVFGLGDAITHVRSLLLRSFVVGPIQRAWRWRSASGCR